MRKEIFIHTSFFLGLFVALSLFRQYFDVSVLLFALGGVVGTILPDIDHLIYIYAYRPHELTSQRVNLMMAKKQVVPTLELLYSTRSERSQLVFHTAFFQIIFAILAFWVISSSGNMFGRGLVLAFMLHLLVDQAVDLNDLGNLENWFSEAPLRLKLTKQKAMFYWLANLILLLIFGFLL